MNNTIEIYNKVQDKVLQHRPHFVIGELTFMEGEEMDKQGKSLVPPFDTTVRVQWTWDEKGALLFPSTVLEEGEEPPWSFANWVGGMPHLGTKATSP
ncbi:hypothetical protein SLEP1_g43120 [Rubroshorea leprosula]|uniref:Uncharacterized protein n=1 Tax=Rubroshorea leprosula TaxID=152421 RepID=A0AAV5LC04_9ROSI|nr:hypothetical protein SLEP1_g43120 [Rubroshorea leprosula]